MCRLLAYTGRPILLEDLVCRPDHSLIHQALAAQEARTVTNGDGFGIGWYGERPIPGCYRETLPAWSDENLRSICAQVRSGLFFAHVRATTEAAVARVNCHPFVHDRFMFMHNGQIGGHRQIRRKVEALIPDELYSARAGSTDSESIFLAALGQGLETDPVGAIARALRLVLELQKEAGITEAFRFAACFTDGDRLWAFRWSSDREMPTLYLRGRDEGTVVVSEPIDGCGGGDWSEVPRCGWVSIPRDGSPTYGSLDRAICDCRD
ncbi:class II glutamine amidotransferase [Siculibacillus lacustris]|uniref:Class II glutamine amidotransferase n=1 Tax=Siculibacillus lacustris TaxID=1549641 RepID=A0A4Q9VJS8_9HYPH|nr:class II glutamine amidotransferase [Siculibacillus lacustris]TBW35110.1 class II glutamine amidotransferase [Siculibacillus lacustris]